MAMGMQDSFSWGQVGMAALGGGITAGVGSSTFASSFSSNATVSAMQQAAVSNMATQGIAVATGMQEKFSWTQVAASTAGAGIGQEISSELQGAGLGAASNDYLGRVTRGTLSGLASGGVYSLASGQSPNWGAVAAQSFGQSLGNVTANKIAERDSKVGNQNQQASTGLARSDYERRFGLSDGQVIDSYTPQMFAASTAQYASAGDIAQAYPNSYAADEFAKWGAAEEVVVTGKVPKSGDEDKFKITFEAQANADRVSGYSKDVLNQIMARSGVKKINITSTVRGPEDQAKAMYANIRSKGVASQKDLYKDAGDKVIDEYVSLNKDGKSKAEIIEGMTKKINELGPSTVSSHAGDPSVLNVIDISPNRMTQSDQKAFIKAVDFYKRQGVVSKFFQPTNGDPAFHLEIPQEGKER